MSSDSQKDPAEWSCKLGPFPEKFLEEGDKLLLFAVKAVYSKIMGKPPGFCASGWDGMRKIHDLRVDPRQYAEIKTMAQELSLRHPATAKRVRKLFNEKWASGEFQKIEKELASKSGS